MAYQIRQKSRIQEELQITNAKGTDTLSLKTDINITQTAKELRVLLVDLINAQKESVTTEDIEKIGNIFISLLNLIFGAEQTQLLLTFYEQNYIDLINDITPFIFDVVKPSMDKYVASYKEDIAKNNSLNRHQKRKLKIL